MVGRDPAGPNRRGLVDRACPAGGGRRRVDAQGHLAQAPARHVPLMGLLEVDEEPGTDGKRPARNAWRHDFARGMVGSSIGLQLRIDRGDF